jgi:hypothetical protein
MLRISMVYWIVMRFLLLDLLRHADHLLGRALAGQELGRNFWNSS